MRSHVAQIWLVLNFPVPDLCIMAFDCYSRRNDEGKQRKIMRKDRQDGKVKIESCKSNWNWRACCWGCPGKCCFCLDDRFLTKHISAVMLNKEELLKGYESERFVVSKAFAKLPPKLIKDESFSSMLQQKTASSSKYSERKSKSEVSEQRPDELSCMKITENKFNCSTVKKTPNRIIRFYRRSVPKADLLSILEAVNIVIQNHIDRFITGTTAGRHRNGTLASANKWEWSSSLTQDTSSNNIEEGNGNDDYLNVENGLRDSFKLISLKSDATVSVDSGEKGRRSLTREEIHELSTMDTLTMLDRLPSLSEIVKEELDVVNEHYHNHFGVLLQRQQIQQKNLIQLKPEDRWFALLYTDNTKRVENDHLHVFQYLIIRLILLSYCVAFEERDVSQNIVLQEFVQRFHGKEFEVKLPFVFSLEMFIGSYDVMYGLHNRRLMSLIFKHNVLSPTLYMEWRRRNPDILKESLTLQVTSWAYPRITDFLQDDFGGRRGSLRSQSLYQFRMCAKTIKRSMDFWKTQIGRKYWDPDLRLYVLLKCTINKALVVMETLLFLSKSSSSNSGSSVSASSILSENVETAEQERERTTTPVDSSDYTKKARSNTSLTSLQIPPLMAKARAKKRKFRGHGSDVNGYDSEEHC